MGSWKNVIRAAVMGMCGVTFAAEPPVTTKPLPLDKSAAAMTLPKGFSSTLFAGEPDVMQPIALAIDERGRLWVAECYSYPKWAEKGTDRILILEDTDGDGRHDKRTVFAENFGYLTGLTIGDDGVWVACAPHVLFFPDKDHDDTPDGPPEIHLEGWNHKGVHNVVNGLLWGPDGWLYGANGITVDSNVKVAGAPESERVKMNCGIWRYHPRKKKFEVWCVGTTNPWGIDFDERGQLFFSSSVTPHFYHGLFGAHFQRMHGKDFNPHIYEFMKTCADHLHWGSTDWNSWTKSRNVSGANDTAGGGHSHCGLTLYYGDQFPPEYRGTAFLNNIHGNRINNDQLERKGSGFVAKHRPDFMLANDKWYRGINVAYGPDGSLFATDWSDTGECHDLEAVRETGRVYRITYGQPKHAPVDLRKLTDAQLVDLQTSTNEFLVRTARRILRSRPVAGETVQSLNKLLASANPIHRLRALWTLHWLGQTRDEMLVKLLDDKDEYVRGWAIQLLTEDSSPSDAVLARFLQMFKSDTPAVRLYLASAAQRIPLEKRADLAAAMLADEGAAGDQNLPLMYWYAVEPLVGADPAKGAALLRECRIPSIRQFITRRIAAAAKPQP